MSQLSGKPKKFEYLEHPADIGVRVYGKTLNDLFKNAALALYDVFEPSIDNYSKRYKRKIVLISGTIGDLLISFLNEILFLCVKSHLIFEKFFINISHSNDENKLECEMIGRKISAINREVKAATYHNAKVQRVDGYLYIDIIFDV